MNTLPRRYRFGILIAFLGACFGAATSCKSSDSSSSSGSESAISCSPYNTDQCSCEVGGTGNGTECPGPDDPNDSSIAVCWSSGDWPNSGSCQCEAATCHVSGDLCTCDLSTPTASDGASCGDLAPSSTHCCMKNHPVASYELSCYCDASDGPCADDESPLVLCYASALIVPILTDGEGIAACAPIATNSSGSGPSSGCSSDGDCSSECGGDCYECESGSCNCGFEGNDGCVF